MASKNKIVWTDKAVETLENLLYLIEEEWGERIVNRFKVQLGKSLQLLQIFPQVGSESFSEKGLRRWVMNKHVSISYEWENEAIIIHYLFDNRQDSQKLP